ncbi:MAG: hypothetical protein WBP49_14285 [Acidimicrobiia bacterium]
MERGSARWSLVVVVVPALVVFGVFLPLVVFWSRYPDPLAVHWGFSGPPDGEMALLAYVSFLAAGLVLNWGALIAGSRQSMPPAPLTAVTYFIMGLLAAVNAQIVIANLDAVSWETADEMSAPLLIGVLVVGVGAGAIGWFAAGGAHGVPVDVPLVAASASSGDWSGSASNGWVAFGATLPVLLVLFVDPIWTILMVAIAIVMIAFSSVRVDAEEQGVTINIGPFGWPRSYIPMEEITGAAAFDVKPMAYGGWGYRMRSGVRAFIIRSGSAIRIERSQGPDTLVTVDDAAVGAASIGALARR